MNRELKVNSDCSKCWSEVELHFIEKGIATKAKYQVFEGECPNCMITISTRIIVNECNHEAILK